MTGPQYPPAPPAGSNGIGLFAIGVSPLGDIVPFSVWQTIISQYANSPIIDKLAENIESYIDQTRNMSNFFDDIWNINTAIGYGLDVWGRIVGVNRTLAVAQMIYFGFAEALPGSLSFGPGATPSYTPSFGFAESTSWQTFGYGTFGLNYQWSDQTAGGGIFYSGQRVTSNFTLNDETYRMLILAKARANITNGSIPAINQILMSLFPGRGNAYVTEGYQGGEIFFGFAEAKNTLPFNQGVFYNSQTITTMSMTYTFNFSLSAVELAIVESSGVLPKSTGVSVSVVING